MLRAFANVSVYYSVDKACCLFYYVGELLVEYICLDGMISYSDKIASTNPVSAMKLHPELFRIMRWLTQ